MTVDDIIKQKLTEAFTPEMLEVVNESHLHAGHAGSPGTGSSHFRVTVVSAKFERLSRVDRHRLVNEALRQELAGPVHALAIETKTPAEAGG